MAGRVPTARRHTLLSLAATAVLGGVLFLLAAGTAVPARAADAPFARDSARAEIVSLINGERVAAGLKPLTVDLLLANRAHDASFACPGGGRTPGRALDIAAHAGLTHILSGCPGLEIPDVMPAWGYRGATGEILAYNYESSEMVTYHFGCPPGSKEFDCDSSAAAMQVSRTAATALRQWTDSPRHHAIILGEYDRFGCGAASGTATTEYGTGGQFYACVFAKGGPANRLDTRAPAVRGVSVAAAGVAGAGTGGSAASPAVVVSALLADTDSLGRVAGWQVAVDGVVVVAAQGAGRIDAGRGSIHVEARVSTAGVAAGTHAVSIRTQDMAGRWSAVSTTMLVIAP
jgi:uncharacterized protein YkwD